jgi:hypothetical protein
MWILCNGKITGVQILIDPTWSKLDIWSFSNMYAKLINLGYSENDSRSYATAYIWKKKWPETVFHHTLEKTLTLVCS